MAIFGEDVPEDVFSDLLERMLDGGAPEEEFLPGKGEPADTAIQSVAEAVEAVLKLYKLRYCCYTTFMGLEYRAAFPDADFILTVDINRLTVTFSVLFPFVAREKKQDDLYRFMIRSNENRVFGRYGLDSANGEVRYEHTVTNHGEITTEEILTYASYLKTAAAEDFDKLKKYCLPEEPYKIVRLKADLEN